MAYVSSLHIIYCKFGYFRDNSIFANSVRNIFATFKIHDLDMIYLNQKTTELFRYFTKRKYSKMVEFTVSNKHCNCNNKKLHALQTVAYVHNIGHIHAYSETTEMVIYDAAISVKFIS